MYQQALPPVCKFANHARSIKVYQICLFPARCGGADIVSAALFPLAVFSASSPVRLEHYKGKLSQGWVNKYHRGAGRFTALESLCLENRVEFIHAYLLIGP